MLLPLEKTFLIFCGHNILLSVLLNCHYFFYYFLLKKEVLTFLNLTTFLIPAELEQLLVLSTRSSRIRQCNQQPV